tara:strand:- start:56230 stop:57855 length:1626 start_codon:yes stop_codon:yes gene_type:complete
MLAEKIKINNGGEGSIKKLFSDNTNRFDDYSLKVGNMLFDYSKNLVTDETMGELFQLARDADVESWREKMFTGEHINITENRPALHIALRKNVDEELWVDGVNVMGQVAKELKNIERFVYLVRSGERLGYSGKKITDVVSIGIGGSNLGPEMVTEALSQHSDGNINVHYVSNVDSAEIARVLQPLNPECVLFVLSSKTFKTRETLINAKTARHWLLASSFDESAVGKHFVAVTANHDSAVDFGISKENIFNMWDWVGGRFSMWSSIGLVIALHLGFEKFLELLSGARFMDEHFRDAPLEKNMPIIQALIGVWNSTFMGAQSQAILPYNQSLHMFPSYLQQADMESNGKSVDRDGNPVPYTTGPIIWGEVGINGQHAFYQFLHQGKTVVPADFIGAINSQTTAKDHREYMMANLFAQTQALMNGIDESQVRAALKAKGVSDHEIETLVAHKIHAGNRPTNTILLDRITAFSLGSLIALYEHKIFIQGIIWRICSFDQWGVELGKEMADNILHQFDSGVDISQQDSSTMGLIRFYKERIDGAT